MEKQNEYKVDMSESPKSYPDEREGMLRASDSDSVGDCPKRGKEGPCGTSDDQACMSQDQEIQIQCQHIETGFAILHNLLIERANMEFWTRVKMLTEGMK